MKKRHVIGLLLLSVALSHALAPAIAWAQFKAQNAFYSLTVTDTVTASGDVTADQYVASGSASQYSCSKTDGTCQFSSATADGTTSSTVGSFTFKAGANITAADLLLDVQDSAGAHALKVTEAGSLTALDTINSSSTSGSVASIGLPVTGFLGFNGTALTGAYLYSPSTAALWFGVGGGTENILNATELTPGSSGGSSLGATATPWLNLFLSGNITGNSNIRGTCTLNGASPAVCTATVTAAALCTCSIVGGTAAIAAKGCAVGLSGTTLTITSANGAGEAVNYHCIL